MPEREFREGDAIYPSRLILGIVANRPLHVVAAEVPDLGTTIIVTVYEPDKAKWDSTFRTRVKP